MADGAAEWKARLDQLRRDVPRQLAGEVIRDQAYAQYQHETLELNHPNGGQPKYQEAALLAKHPEYLQRVADGWLDGRAVDAMAEAMDLFGDDSGELTPKDTETLANSDRARVVADGQVVRDRPPLAPRLSDEELEQVHRKVYGRYPAHTGPNRQPPPGTTGRRIPRGRGGAVRG